LKVTIREAREKLMPALDDDFAKDTGEADTLEELKVKLRADLVERKQKDVQDELRKALIRELLKRNEFPVPSVLVDRQTDVLLQRARLSLAMRGVDPRSATVDETKLKDELRPAAADEVRAVFLIDAIATKEKVEVADADLEKRLAEMAKERDKSVARLKAELQKESKIDALKHQLREEKTLDLLLTRANIKAKPLAASPSEK
jgi:trigger factor